jgi:hypothetical protein
MYSVNVGVLILDRSKLHSLPSCIESQDYRFGNDFWDLEGSGSIRVVRHLRRLSLCPDVQCSETKFLAYDI